MLNQFRTKEPCNRFCIGNCIEHIIIEDILRNCGLKVSALPNAKRIDLTIIGYDGLAVAVVYDFIKRLQTLYKHLHTDATRNRNIP